MDGNLYDEFGNYIGPEIEDEEEEDAFIPPHEEEDEDMAAPDEDQAMAEAEEGMIDNCCSDA